MRARIVYESIFGNTRAVAEAIADGMRPDVEVEVVEVEEAARRHDDVDLLIVGGPTHAWSMSRNLTRRGARAQARDRGLQPSSRGPGVREWLAGLRHAPNTRMAAAFDTAVHATGPLGFGSAARSAAIQLEDRGFRLVSAPEQFFVKDVAGPLLDRELERARVWGLRLAARAKTGAFVPDTPRVFAAVVALAGHALALMVINLHAWWRPWTLGVVTPAWAGVTDILGFACLVGIIGNGLLIWQPSRRWRAFVACAVAMANLAAGLAVYQVFPFDFGAVGLPWFDPIFAAVLLFALLGSLVGFVGALVRLVLQLLRG